jgi:uncharacterized RDD family membrane protein YckC
MDEVGSTTYTLASFGTRFLAYLIDSVLIYLAYFVFTVVLGFFLPLSIEDPDLLNILLIAGQIIFAVYHWYFLTRQNGQTPGKRIMNIRVVKADGTPISDVDAVLRIFGYLVGQVLLYLGYFWMLFDAQSQTWQDKMANTYVVETGEGPRTISL